MEGAARSLDRGVRELGLVLDPIAIERLEAYLALIAKWTRVYNLTAVREPGDMLSHHLFDSLAVVSPLRRHLAQAALGRRATALDVGSGAGLPGVVLAICCPDLLVTCVDAVNKKTAFVRQVAAELALANLAGLHARVETITTPFDLVVSRAFASLANFTTWSAPALAPRGVWMAMKGNEPTEEIAALPPHVEVFHVEQLTVPSLNAARCIVWARHADGFARTSCN